MSVLSRCFLGLLALAAASGPVPGFADGDRHPVTSFRRYHLNVYPTASPVKSATAAGPLIVRTSRAIPNESDRARLPRVARADPPVSYGPGLSSERIEAIESLIRLRMEENHVPGASAAIALDGTIVWAEGFGLADVENHVAATPETRYRTASIGKPMTATAVLQLVERGKLNLDAPIQEYCPSFPKKRATLTTRHLLGHLGGVRHYGGPNEEAELFNTKHYESVIDALEIFAEDPLVHEPGSAYLYSTFGYNILGCVIEGVAGVPYLNYMADQVFARAGMKDTRDDDPSAIIPNRAGGYRLSKDGKLVNARVVDMSSKLPAGGFITTAPDLARFASSLMKGELVTAGTFEEMTTPQSTSDGTKIPYGLGWGLFLDDLWYGEKEVFHGGGTPGMSGVLYLLPGRSFAVAFLGNLEEIPDRVGLAAQVAKRALNLGSGEAGEGNSRRRGTPGVPRTAEVGHAFHRTAHPPGRNSGGKPGGRSERAR